MAITPEDLLKLASRLGNDPTEVAQRAAASRAYYAAYHLAQWVAAQHKIPLAKPSGSAGVHENFIVALERCGGLPPPIQSKLRTVGTLLRQCRDLRAEADYRIHDEFPASKALQAISLCRRVDKMAQELQQ